MRLKATNPDRQNVNFGSSEPSGRPTCVCERLDVVRQVDVDTLCVFHLLEDDSNKPHGHKVVPIGRETHTEAP